MMSLEHPAENYRMSLEHPAEKYKFPIPVGCSVAHLWVRKRRGYSFISTLAPVSFIY
jgi:hypothetical protein